MGVILFLVFQRLHRGRQAAAAVDEDRRVALVDRHDGAIAQQSKETD